MLTLHSRIRPSRYYSPDFSTFLYFALQRSDPRKIAVPHESLCGSFHLSLAICSQGDIRGSSVFMIQRPVGFSLTDDKNS